ncbi:mannitol-1-phosphate dehydrogenase M1PDH1 [Coprinopsis sp. MPI-PUGE-AT-0042]|nr:mannitol-1-phosphate dehydrogenase M1PDH1 [Coprinopsis sp. MPI-PUGE-AT-0042]
MSTKATSIPLTQRAAVLTEIGKEYTIRSDWPVTQPQDLEPNQCLIKLEYSGVCHSDLSVKNAAWGAPAKTPLVGGHEGIGRIVAIGENSATTGPKVGDRVGIKWIGRVCNHCTFCRKGNESACTTSFQIIHGKGIHGSFQEFAVSYLDYVTPIPEGGDVASLTPILCAGLTVYKALKQANAHIGDWIAISGAGGGLGHLGVQYASAMGLRVLAIDTGEKKKDLVMRLGAEKWIDFKESKDIIKDIQAATGGGPQAAVITAGDPRPFNQAVMYLRPTGTLVAVGMPGGDAQLSLPIPLIIGKSLNIIGSAIGNRQDVAEALEIAARGKVKCEYEVRELEDINKIFDELQAGTVAGRIVVRLNPEQA